VEGLGLKEETQTGHDRDDGKVKASVGDLEQVMTVSCCWLCGVSIWQPPLPCKMRENRTHPQLWVAESPCWGECAPCAAEVGRTCWSRMKSGESASVCEC
jgi:hypothetical protein